MSGGLRCLERPRGGRTPAWFGRAFLVLWFASLPATVLLILVLR